MRIDRRRKLPVTTLLLALGLDQETILATFYNEVAFRPCRPGLADRRSAAEQLRGQKLTSDLVDAATGDTLAEAGTKLTPRLVKKLEEQGLDELYFSDRGAGRQLSGARPDRRADRPRATPRPATS